MGVTLKYDYYPILEFWDIWMITVLKEINKRSLSSGLTHLKFVLILKLYQVIWIDHEILAQIYCNRQNFQFHCLPKFLVHAIKDCILQ